MRAASQGWTQPADSPLHPDSTVIAGFDLTTGPTIVEDESSGQLNLDLALAVEFNRSLDCVPQCALTSRLWSEVHPIDLATTIVSWMSDSAVAYVLGSESAVNVEPADTWQAAGIYELFQSCDSRRTAAYIGKSDVNTRYRMKSHRYAKKTKGTNLHRFLRSFKDREFRELLLVPIPSAAPGWFRCLWHRLCPQTSSNWNEPLRSLAIRSTFVSTVEAAFIALRRSFRKHPPYEQLADQTFGTPAGTIGLNSTPGTEDNAARVEGVLAYFKKYRPAVDVLRSQLINEVAGEAGGLPRPALAVLFGPGGGTSLRWRLNGMPERVTLSHYDAELFSIDKRKHRRGYRMEFRVEYEADFVAIDQLTVAEATSITGTKISFKIWSGEAALGGWWPLRSRKATPEVMFLYKEATDAVRLCGGVPEIMQEATEDTPPQNEDRTGWDASDFLDLKRILQSLAEGRYYARAYSYTSTWETGEGHKEWTHNRVDILLPQKQGLRKAGQKGKTEKLTLLLNFLPHAGERCHTWLRVNQQGFAAVTRPASEPRELTPAAEDFVAMPAP